VKHRGVYMTDAGMHCLWDSTAFEGVTDYDSWARELLEDRDIERHICAGHFVPLNIGSDGAMEVELRVGTKDQPAELTPRDTQYLIVASQPYLFRSSGSVSVSGIERVSGSPEGGSTAALPKGQYSARVHLIAWDEEPGMQTENGPAKGALPDYIVLINPVADGEQFRTAVKTFK
jgi:hypothetical protein